MGHVMGTGDCCVPRDIFLNEIQNKQKKQGERPVAPWGKKKKLYYVGPSTSVHVQRMQRFKPPLM